MRLFDDQINLENNPKQEAREKFIITVNNYYFFIKNGCSFLKMSDPSP